MKSVSSDIYTEDYFAQRCGGVEFFQRYKADILKPSMQLAVMRAELKPGMKILDVGCGRGELTANLAAKGYDAVGIDYSEASISLAKNHFPSATFILGDLFKAGFKEKSFDRIFLLGTIEHLYDEEIVKTMNELERLIKPGGKVLITTCTNALYHKSWTYQFRAFIVRVLNKVGFSMKPPSAPRSGEDVEMHVNEQGYFSLKKHFSKDTWRVQIEPRLNSKHYVEELYGRPPEGFPLRSASPLKRAAYKLLMAVPFAKLIVSRFNLVVLTRHA